VQFSADVTGKGGKVRPGMQAALGGDHIEAGERPLQIRSRFQLAEGEVHLAPGIHDWRLQTRNHRSLESRVGAHRLQSVLRVFFSLVENCIAPSSVRRSYPVPDK
jgi:hypothetical protein